MSSRPRCFHRVFSCSILQNVRSSLYKMFKFIPFFKTRLFHVFLSSETSISSKRFLQAPADSSAEDLNQVETTPMFGLPQSTTVQSSVHLSPLMIEIPTKRTGRYTGSKRDIQAGYASEHTRNPRRSHPDPACATPSSLCN